MAINIPVNNGSTKSDLKLLVGNTVTLATEKGRLWHRQQWNFLILCWNPFIILTMFSNIIKDQLCNFFNNGHIVVPSGEGTSHLMHRNNKMIPTTTFLAALLNSGVELIRVINFPPLPRDLLLCNATQVGYPPN